MVRGHCVNDGARSANGEKKKATVGIPFLWANDDGRTREGVLDHQPTRQSTSPPSSYERITGARHHFSSRSRLKIERRVFFFFNAVVKGAVYTVSVVKMFRLSCYNNMTYTIVRHNGGGRARYV
uniref:Uncharacterized protein n=1 Tax=Sipha flava TaxID=143950 RepID=A0A2S2QB46_9HEMI